MAVIGSIFIHIYVHIQSHITPLLAKLHWLPMKAGVTFKLATLTYNIHQTGSPPNLSSILSVYKPVRNLRSSVQYLLEVTVPSLMTSESVVRHIAVAVRNSLLHTIRECGTVETFRKHLKPHLYNNKNLSCTLLPFTPTNG